MTRADDLDTATTAGAVDASRTDAAADDWNDPRIQLGARMGRYQLQAMLGAGGMGVVFAARDPELDRTVAVKILRSDHGVDGERRMRREGQTMARLTHPNVLRVYDVGVDHGHVFVAMEYVSGGTLGEWLAREPRTPAAIVATFVQAGLGLAAAHDAGLVHRDFKPANVLVDGDGRVLVTDFGLARAAAATDDAAPTAAAADGEAVSTTVTRAGQQVGTPSYMAPEQHAGAAVDARADQFSFCVGAWRALYGAAPFAGTTASELATSTTAGALTPPPADAALRASPRIRAALERGLRVAPEQRFPSMRELLAELAPPPARDRRWLIAVAAAAAVGLAIVVGGVLLLRGRGDRAATAGDPCAVDRDRFGAVWSRDAAAAVQAHLRALHAPYADAAFADVRRQLDARAVAWEAMRRDSCEDTRVRREQSDAMMDLRAACLDARLLDVEQLVSELQRIDEPGLREVGKSMVALGDVAACGEVAALARRAPLPSQPDQRAAIAAVERELAAARAKAAAGRHQEVRDLADALIARARATGYAPLLAEALAVVAPSLTALDDGARAAALLDEAVLAAEAGGDDLLRFDCEAQLVRVVGYHLERYADGVAHAQRAEALLTRLGADPRRAATLALARATLEWSHGNYAEAKVHAQRAIELTTALDPRGTELSASLHMRAITEDELGENAAALATEQQALAIAEPILGADHPRVANMMETEAGSLRRLDRLDEARAIGQRVLAIRERVYGAASQMVGMTLFNLATVDLDEGKLDTAIPMLRRALATVEQAKGADSGDAALVGERLGSALSKAGKLVEAEPVLTRALAINRARIGPDSPQAAGSSKQLGDHYLRAAEPARARDAYREAVRAFQTSQGAATPMATKSLVGVGDAEAALGHRAAAAAAYQQALAVMRPDAKSLRADVEAKLAAAR